MAGASLVLAETWQGRAQILVQDLNEISVRFVQPLHELVQSVTKFKYFLDAADVPSVEAHLRQRQALNPTTGAYCLSFNVDEIAVSQSFYPFYLFSG